MNIKQSCDFSKMKKFKKESRNNEDSSFEENSSDEEVRNWQSDK